MKPIKKWMKIALDAVLFIVLALMYKKQAVSMSFHEIGGLALIGVFVIHHVFNGQWIKAVTCRLFQKETPARTRIQYIVDCLLLVLFLLIGVSGALISKVVFSFGAVCGGWKTVHYFCAALAVVFTGVHIGLHAAYLFGFLRKRGKVVRIVAYILLSAVLVFGVYNIGATSFGKWIAMPFTASADGMGAGHNSEQHSAAGETADQANGQHLGQGNGANRGNDMQLHGSGQGSGSLTGALTTFVQFASVMVVFAAAAGLTDRLIRSRKTRPAKQ